MASDLTGRRFGQLTVIRRDHADRGGTYWLCVCDCGQEYDTPVIICKRNDKYYGKTVDITVKPC